MPTTVVLIVYPNATFGELVPLAQMLASAKVDAGVSLRIGGPRREPVRVSEGYRVAIDQTYDEIDLGEAALVAVAGGDPESVLDDLSLASLLDRAAARGVTLAAICNGALLLGRAGVLRGRAVTHTACEPYATRPAYDALLDAASSALRGAHYVDEDVVIDEDPEGATVLTAKPWAAIEWAKRSLVAAGLVERASAASRARYLRGVRDAGFGDAYQRWVIELTQVAEKPASRDDIEAHVAHLRALERRGALELAGPISEAKSGLVVIRAASREEAERVAREDPFVARGVRTVAVRRWTLSCDDNDHLLSPKDAGRAR